MHVLPGMIARREAQPRYQHYLRTPLGMLLIGFALLGLILLGVCLVAMRDHLHVLLVLPYVLLCAFPLTALAVYAWQASTLESTSSMSRGRGVR